MDSLAETRRKIATLSEADKSQLSADWLNLLADAKESDPWVVGFTIQMRATGVPVGQCGFKGPPTEHGEVEIAYAVEPEYQGKGLATEAARALVDYAFSQDGVMRVLAHTLLETSASTRVLTKCGFKNVGEVVDPEDGPVLRWEITR